MTLTLDQTRAIQNLHEFFASDDNVFLLKGSAGSGKTTIVRHVIEEMANKNCQLMAPTGRAALILSQKTGRQASTIHRQIYTVEPLDESEKGEDDFKTYFALNDCNDSANTIYLIDESSMVSDKFSDNEAFIFGSGFLLSDLLEYCNLTHTHRKIVFIGDFAQLSPVGQNISPALDAQYLSEKYSVKVRECMMREVVRQMADSGIYQNASLIRDSIEAKHFNEFSLSSSADIYKTNIEEFLPQYYETTHNKIDIDTIVIAYSNRQAVEYNIAIRRKLFNTDSRIADGELLLVTRNNYQNQTELFNGTIVAVEAFSNVVETMEVELKSKKVSVDFRNVTIVGGGKYTIIDSFLTDVAGALPIDIQKAIYKNFKIRMWKEGIKPKTTEFKSRRKEDPYLNALQCKYGYAITCHKAQGGEWANVFIDMDRFGGKANENYFRWAYTAITRSNNKVWYMSAPNFNAINQFVVREISYNPNVRISYHRPANIDFRDWRRNNIAEICNSKGIRFVDIRNVQYQHRFSFSLENDLCEVSFWYNKDFYTGKIDVLKSTNTDFRDTCIEICKRSLLTDEIPFSTKFPFQNRLHEHISNIAREMEIRIVDITQRQWSDVYFLETDSSFCSIEFFYNSKHIYTYAQPISAKSVDDEFLKFINAL